MSTALREADEEAAIAATSVEPIALWIDDHGGWSYTTVLARPTTVIAPRAANAESTDVRWWRHTEIDSLSLHQGLAATWPHVRRPPLPVSIIVDSRSDQRFVALLAGIGRRARSVGPTDPLRSAGRSASRSSSAARVCRPDWSASPWSASRVARRRRAQSASGHRTGGERAVRVIEPGHRRRSGRAARRRGLRPHCTRSWSLPSMSRVTTDSPQAAPNGLRSRPGLAGSSSSIATRFRLRSSTQHAA